MECLAARYHKFPHPVCAYQCIYHMSHRHCHDHTVHESCGIMYACDGIAFHLFWLATVQEPPNGEKRVELSVIQAAWDLWWAAHHKAGTKFRPRKGVIDLFDQKNCCSFIFPFLAALPSPLLYVN